MKAKKVVCDTIEQFKREGKTIEDLWRFFGISVPEENKNAKC